MEGSTPVSDAHRLTPEWIDLCNQHGLNPETTTKLEVAGSTPVSDAHRLTPKWIDLCNQHGLNPETATKLEVARAESWAYKKRDQADRLQRFKTRYCPEGKR